MLPGTSTSVIDRSWLSTVSEIRFVAEGRTLWGAVAVTVAVPTAVRILAVERQHSERL